MEVSYRGLNASRERSRLRMPEQRSRGKVPVVYYLCRNGQLEQPHFMEVPLSSADGLYLRDVIDRFDFLRGKGMAGMYSWSYKRSYKNGFVWHDLCDKDQIQWGMGDECILKGSELLCHSPSIQNSQGTAGSLQTPKQNSDSPMDRCQHTSWSSRSLDLGECKVCQNELTDVSAVNAADATTQTDEKHRRRRAQTTDDDRDRLMIINPQENTMTELGRHEISPPLSASSPETLESLIKADGGLINAPVDGSSTLEGGGGGGGSGHSGRFRASASAVVMHLFSCGSFLSVLPHGSPSNGRDFRELNGIEARSMRVDEVFYSGSLVETKKKHDVAQSAADSGPLNAER